ncbi:hypothetical protein [Dyella sp. RRB7]|uniref:hypothetical protein n=1 Tax=Dyella sp. RRB7 TaxID=2919502 RepID=UPI001FAB1045|nr:hypothetical protein [Dyella sp. RRB7]
MKIIRITSLMAACLLTAPVWAQDSGQPLNLKLPANVPAASASSAAPATTDTKPASTTGQAATPPSQGATASTAPANANGSKDPPGTYYGDTSGALGDTQAAVSQPVVTCDDATYNQPQVHGSVTTGVVSGNHFSGGYTGGGVTLSQAFGSCEHPTGGMSISVGGTQGHFGR